MQLARSTPALSFIQRWILAAALASQVSAASPELISATATPVRAQEPGLDVQPGLDQSGRWLVFTSSAPHLDGDRNGLAPDVYLRDLTSGTLTRVSHRLGGAESGNGASHSALITPDGRWVVFASEASDLVDADTNQASDIFVWSRETGAIHCASRTPLGLLGNNASTHPQLSGDGRYLFFESLASDLTSGDTNSVRDLFRHDLSLGTTECVTLSTQGGPPVPAGGFDCRISFDGQQILFRSASALHAEPAPSPAFTVFHRDLASGLTRQLAPSIPGLIPNQVVETHHQLSANGHHATVTSRPVTSAVDGVTNTLARIHLFDLADGSSREIGEGVAFDAACRAIPSADGRRVVFDGYPTNQAFSRRTQPFVWDSGIGTRSLPDLILTMPPVLGQITNASLMALHPDGQRVLLACAQADLFPSAATNSVHLVEYTFITGRLRLLSQNPNHKPIDGALLPDVLYAPGTQSILFAVAPSPAAEAGPDEWPGVFLAGPEPADPIRQPQPDLSQQRGNTSRHPSVAAGAVTSDDGRFVLFHSHASDLGIPLGADRSQNLYLHDRTAGTTTLITPPISPEADHRGVILDASMSGDASRVVFASSRSDLVSDDGNGAFDVFLWTRATGQLRAISASISGTGTAANVPRPTTSPAGSVRPFLQRDGAAILFESTSRDLIPNEPQNTARFEVYRHDLNLGVTQLVSYRPNPGGYAGEATRYSRMSDDGSVIAFAHDVRSTTGGVPVLYRPGTRSWTPLFPAEPVVDTFISPAGNHVGFFQRPAGATTGRNLVVWNTATTNVVLSLPIGPAALKSLHFSADGSSIAFSTTASLHSADTNLHSDVYLIRLTNGVPVLISSSPSGFAGNGISDQPALSSDGSQMAFRSRATDLTADPVSSTGDVFIHDTRSGKTRRPLESPAAPSSALHPVFTRDGSAVLFTTASEFDPADRNGTHDVYRLELSDAPAPIQIRISTSPAGGWQLRWTGSPGAHYQAESSERLDQGWAPISGPLTGAGADLTLEDARPATQTRFYRVSLLP